jgi:hypothetical protein
VPGILVLVQGFPPNWRYVRERERDRQHRNGLAEPGVTWRAGVRSFPFWIIVAVLFVGSVTVNGAVTQMVALLTDRAISVRAAALCASMLGASSLGGRLFVGWLLDHFTGSREAFAVTLLPATGVLLLARLTALPMASLAAALMGFCPGAEADITPYLLTRCYGLRSFSTL